MNSLFTNSLIDNRKWTEAELQELPTLTMYLPSRYNEAYRVHPTVEVNGIDIDEDLAPLLQLLWSRGINTATCCQGHAADYHISAGLHGWGYILFCDFDQAVDFLRFTAKRCSKPRMMGQFKLTATADDSLGEASITFPPLLIPLMIHAWQNHTKED